MRSSHVTASHFALALCLFAASLPLANLAGCASRTSKEANQDAEKQKKKEKPKPPFDRLQVTPEPNEKAFVDPQGKGNQIVTRAIKPGHWTGLLVTTTANQFDFSGDLSCAALDGLQNPIFLDRSTYSLTTTRPAALGKGQRKTLEAVFLAPSTAMRSQTYVATQLHSRSQGDAVREQEILQHMPSFQYFMVVLAREARRYRYLKVLDCVRPPSELSFNLPEDEAYYRVLLPSPGDSFALPRRSLCWTSVACIVWDDVLPTALSGEQQTALVDWLHWGGRLIVSGPQTLDALAGSFLDPYLPGRASATASLDDQRLSELNAHWTIDHTADLPTRLKLVAPWSGTQLEKHPAAEFIPHTGGLAVERRVGRGRIVATAFRLTERELVTWRCFDSFVNGALLGRPPRRYDPRGDQYAFLPTDFAEAAERFDPEVVTGVRFLTRDIKPFVERPKQPPAAPPPSVAVPGISAPAYDTADEMQASALKSSAGIAGWNDFSWIADAARETLREAAGISVPNRNFVLWVLGSYLVVVVPANWLVFRLLGRVEWAWIAVPLLAGGWGVAVVWLAQLDIGFARAETEIDVVEVQPDYPRAHLTRYAALYTSLSTSYDVQFDDPAALALPFSSDIELLAGQSRMSVVLAGGSDARLEGYSASSNTTGMIHAEQYIDLGGGFQWRVEHGRPATVVNGTKLKLSDAVVLRRRITDEGEVINETARVGDLIPGAEATVEFVGAKAPRRTPRGENGVAESASEPRSERTLSLRRMLDRLEDHDWLEPGEARLIGWREGSVPGMNIAPAAAQARRATVVVVNLQFARHVPRPDDNVRSVAKRNDELEDAMEETP